MLQHQSPRTHRRSVARRIHERASLVVSFIVPHAAPIPLLQGLVDTGSGVTILTFSAFNRVAVQPGAVLKP